MVIRLVWMVVCIVTCVGAQRHNWQEWPQNRPYPGRGQSPGARDRYKDAGQWGPLPDDVYVQNTYGSRKTYENEEAAGKYCKPQYEEPDKDIPTDKGHVRGKVIYFWEKDLKDPFEQNKICQNVTVFRGIPYAEPPLGERRFREPEPPRNWGAVLDATQYRPACPQKMGYPMSSRITQTSEDCLYLNIYTPGVTEKHKTYPVIVFIHGGSYEYESGETWPGHKLGTKLVVVTFNYRLGPLGFLSTKDGYATGNYGMRDQIMAMQFVKNNIHNFKGDPDRITLLGQSAGAASVGLHILSELSTGLFHGAIMLSGASTAEWAVFQNRDQAHNHTIWLGQRVGCTHQNSVDLIDCLRSRNAGDLVEVEIEPEYGLRTVWAPVIENVDGDLPYGYKKFLVDDPIRMLRDGNIPNRVPVMHGVTKDESSHTLYQNHDLAKNGYKVTEEYFDTWLWDFVQKENYSLVDSVNKAIYDSVRHEYTFWPDRDNTTATRQMMINMMSDQMIIGPQVLAATRHTENNMKTFFYVFDFRSWGNRSPNWTGVTHGVDLNYLFGMPFVDSLYPEWQALVNITWTPDCRNTSQFMMEIVENFAAFTSPLSCEQGSCQLPYRFENVTRWDAFTKERRYYFRVNSSCDYLAEDPFYHRASFWNDYIPVAREMDLPTVTPTPLGMTKRQAEAFRGATWGLVAVALLFIFILMGTCLYMMYQDNKEVETKLKEYPEMNYIPEPLAASRTSRETWA